LLQNVMKKASGWSSERAGEKKHARRAMGSEAFNEKAKFRTLKWSLAVSESKCSYCAVMAY